MTHLYGEWGTGELDPDSAAHDRGVFQRPVLLCDVDSLAVYRTVEREAAQGPKRRRWQRKHADE